MDNDWRLRDIAREWTRNPNDRERAAAWVLLSHLGERITPAFVGSTAPKGLDGERLLSLGWSSTEAEVARAAVSLFNGGEVRLGHLVRYGSDEQLHRMKKAIDILQGVEDPWEWDVVRDPMQESSADVVVDQIEYPWLGHGEFHEARTTLPCGATVSTELGGEVVELLRDVVTTVDDWTVCEHPSCRTQFALAWSRFPKVAPVLLRSMRSAGASSSLLLFMRSGTEHEQEIAEELEQQFPAPYSSPS